MTTTINVDKRSVKQLLETGKNKKFVIPEYQRPYAWSDEPIQVLFDDLSEYTHNTNDDDESTYFLGTIVSYENENHEQEIIDGQQRITTLFLLLRAIYTKLEKSGSEADFLKSQIVPTIWKQNPTTGEVDFDKILITSRVMGDEGNQEFANILITGQSDEKSNSNYAKNYRLLQQLVDEYAAEQPLAFYSFISNILNRAILLPITADTQDTALTIFSTLNDRGLALSDADIFKAKIYNHLDQIGKKNFIERWQQLDEEASNAGESIQKLFYYYMFYLRGAKENDRKTTTPGIRKYYAKNNFERLYSDDIMENLNTILNLWIVINNRNAVDNEKWSENREIKQILDALTSYPNEFWKYPVVIYYLHYHQNDTFEDEFLLFVKRLLAVLSARYIVTPTINAVKTGILNLNAEIIKSPQPKFDFSKVDEKELSDKIKNAHRNTVRMILKIIAYQHQADLLPEKWEIEHILPQKWQSSYFSTSTDSEVKELVEHIGNKIPFEKKLNIIASNGYFAKKKESYNKSKVEILLELSKNHNDWGLDEIRERDIRISDELVTLLNEWGLNQIDAQPEEVLTFMPDDKFSDYQTFIKMFKMEDSNESREKFLNM